MTKTNSKLKCVVEKGAVPTNRLIDQNKLRQLKEKFNTGMAPKTTKRSLNRMSAMASNKQKESAERGETRRLEILAEKESKKVEAETKD